MSLISPCFACGKIFASNPNSVPSFKNEPVCEDCMVVINRRRAEAGLPPFTVPSDAYEAVEVD